MLHGAETIRPQRRTRTSEEIARGKRGKRMDGRKERRKEATNVSKNRKEQNHYHKTMLVI
jgi:hypothetical protein